MATGMRPEIPTGLWVVAMADTVAFAAASNDE